MNDLDLTTALQRDADLVGEPAPDLLDQLRRRRQHQSRQRAGLLAAVAAVVVIAAGIPLGGALMHSSESRPATDPVAPTPTTSTPAPTMPSSTTTPPAPTTVEAPPAVETPATSETPVVEEAPVCPDSATLMATLPPLPVEGSWYVTGNALNPTVTPQCSGSWAVTTLFVAWHKTPGEMYDELPGENGIGLAGGAYLFEYVDGAWGPVRRDACRTGEVPADIEYWACETS
jgi:hypothetical protein